jgi:hypothetical protein
MDSNREIQLEMVNLRFCAVWPNSELLDIDMGNEEDAYLAAAAPKMRDAINELLFHFEAGMVIMPFVLKMVRKLVLAMQS